MSKDLTDALRALMEGDPNTNVIPAAKARGAAPAVTSAAPLPGAAKSGSGSGIASPLVETAYAARQWWSEKQLTTTDGLVTFVIKPVKEVTFQDQAATEIKLQFKAPT